MSVHLLPPLSAPAPVVFEDERYYAPYAAEKTPIVIDNGLYIPSLHHRVQQ